MMYNFDISYECFKDAFNEIARLDYFSHTDICDANELSIPVLETLIRNNPKYTLQIAEITFWRNFQLTTASFDENFIDLLEIDVHSDDCYLVFTDLLNNRAIKFHANKFIAIIDNISWDSPPFSMDFFQPNDYIFINLTKAKINCIHHSGFSIKVIPVLSSASVRV